MYTISLVTYFLAISETKYEENIFILFCIQVWNEILSLTRENLFFKMWVECIISVIVDSLNSRTL